MTDEIIYPMPPDPNAPVGEDDGTGERDDPEGSAEDAMVGLLNRRIADAHAANLPCELAAQCGLCRRRADCVNLEVLRRQQLVLQAGRPALEAWEAALVELRKDGSMPFCIPRRVKWPQH